MNDPESRTETRAASLVRRSGITRRFGKVTVLRNSQLEVRSGEVHVWVGENGAGKCTLIKILAGVDREFEGRIEIGGREVRPPQNQVCENVNAPAPANLRAVS